MSETAFKESWDAIPEGKRFDASNSAIASWVYRIKLGKNHFALVEPTAKSERITVFSYMALNAYEREVIFTVIN